MKEDDRFSRDDIEMFIQCLTLAREKTLLKKELDRIRINNINNIKGIYGLNYTISEPRPTSETIPLANVCEDSESTER